MIEGKTYPLEIASRVLSPDTISSVRHGGFGRLAYSILDRWALNEPEVLRLVEQKGFVDHRLYEQEQVEIAALSSETAARAAQLGISDYEVLEMLGVDTRLNSPSSVWMSALKGRIPPAE